MPGNDPQVISHQLNVRPGTRPTKQNKRNITPNKLLALEEEVDRLLKAKFIREVHHPGWLTNMVMLMRSTKPKVSEFQNQNSISQFW